MLARCALCTSRQEAPADAPKSLSCTTTPVMSVASRVEAATSEALMMPDWMLNVELYDAINADRSGKMCVP
jgi:hypothetical protein